jgi:hypothetical protein
VTVKRVAGRGLKGSDTPTWIHSDLFRVFTLEDGKIRRIEEYPSGAEAVEAARLEEKRWLLLRRECSCCCSN